MHYAIEPGLEVVEGFRRAVYRGAEVQALERRIAEGPMRAVENVTVIHHRRDESQALPLVSLGDRPGLQARAKKDGLACIGIADPFVEGQNTQELVAIGDLVEHKIGDEIVDDHLGGIARIARSEMPARLNGQASRPELNVHVRMACEKLRGQIDDLDRRRRDVQIAQERRRQPLVHQDAAVLRVVAEFYNVKVPVVALKQMRLGSATHFSDQADRVDGHLMRCNSPFYLPWGCRALTLLLYEDASPC